MAKYVLYLTGAFLLLGCDSATGPQNGGDGNADGATHLLATETIGASGGSIQVEALTLTIPGGALTSDHAITVSEALDQDGSAHAASPVYLVQGIPALAGDSLYLEIQPTAPLAYESFIVVGREDQVNLDAASPVAYELFPAAVKQDSLLVAAIPHGAAILSSPVANRAARRAFLEEMLLFAITKQKRYTTPEQHFVFCCAASVYDAVVSLGTQLEELYDHYTRLGFSLKESGGGKTAMGIWVTYHPNMAGRYCHFNYHGGPRFVFNELKTNPADLPVLRQHAARELFYIVPYYGEGQNHMVTEDRYWFHRAAATWAGRHAAGQGVAYGDVPSEFSGNEQAPFDGMVAGALAGEQVAGVKPQRHGDGMTALLFWLLSPDQYGPTVLPEAYALMRAELENMRWETSKPAAALLQTVDDPADVWLPAFFREYVSGKVFGVSSARFMEMVQGTFAVDDAADTLAVFTRDYPDLSAALYRIDLNYPDVEADAALYLRAEGEDVSDGEITLLVFARKDGVLTPLDTGADNVLSIADVREMTRGGWDLLVAVVNSHFHYPDCVGLSQISLEMKVDTPPQSLPHTKARISVHVNGHYDKSNADSYDVAYLQFFQGKGQFEQATFTAVWDTTKLGDVPYRGSMTVVLDPSLTEVVYFSVDDTLAGDSYTITNHVSGESIPKAELFAWQLGFQVKDHAACESILDLRYRMENPEYDYVEQLVGYDCTTYSASGYEITIAFEEEDPFAKPVSAVGRTR